MWMVPKTNSGGRTLQWQTYGADNAEKSLDGPILLQLGSDYKTVRIPLTTCTHKIKNIRTQHDGMWQVVQKSAEICWPVAANHCKSQPSRIVSCHWSLPCNQTMMMVSPLPSSSFPFTKTLTDGDDDFFQGWIAVDLNFVEAQNATSKLMRCRRMMELIDQCHSNIHFIVWIDCFQELIHNEVDMILLKYVFKSSLLHRF
jgi:hypothetical protein